MPGPSTDFVMPTAFAPFGPVPNGALVPVSVVVVNMMSAFFSNPTAAPIHVTVTDTNGQALIPAVEVEPNATLPLEFPLSEFTGLKWSADAVGLLGQLLGYPHV